MSYVPVLLIFQNGEMNSPEMPENEMERPSDPIHCDFF